MTLTPIWVMVRDIFTFCDKEFEKMSSRKPLLGKLHLGKSPSAYIEKFNRFLQVSCYGDMSFSQMNISRN